MLFVMNNMNPLMNVLPKELVTEIEDMSCKRSVNGSTKSNEILILFELNATAKDVHDTLLQWLFRCLDTISNKVCTCGYQYEWNIISQILHNDFEEEEEEYIQKYGKIRNLTVVAIHLPDDPMSFNDDLTIPHTSSLTLSPLEIMDCLIREPVFVKKIGVRAVASDVMMMWWHGMISEEPNYFDVAGEGYMVHRMWRKGGPESSEWGDWYSIREMSYNFGWKGYKEYHS